MSDGRPALVAFTSGFARCDLPQRLAAQAGCELKAVHAIGADLPPLAPDIAACLVLADAGTDALPLALLLEGLARDAALGGPAVVADVPLDLIDVAAAALAGPATALLSGAAHAELIAALAVVSQEAVQPAQAVGEISAERNALELRRLSEDVERIARVLAALSNERAEPAAAPADLPDEAEDAAPAPELLRLIRALIRARRQRERFFAADLFADPNWDMLLDLMAARLERKRVAVSSLCIAAAVPPTTALRHLKAMTDGGLFVRRPDPGDGRRVFIELSDRAAAGMRRCLGAIAGALQPAA